MPGRTEIIIRIMIQQNNICLGDRFNNGKGTPIHNLHECIEKVILNHLAVILNHIIGFFTTQSFVIIYLHFKWV